ncbi:MAG: molybdate ABC transporter substrate-binding protein [Xanthobacteraceae bacterium]
MGIPSMRVLVAALTLLGMSVTPLSATELRVYSGGAPQETLKLLAPEFEKATGHRVAFTFAVVGAIRQRLEADEKADVVLLPAQLIDALEKAGKIRPDSRSRLARVGIAVVVRAGAPKPDVSTPEALRAALLQARSITHADPQATPGGRHIAALLKQWDITDTPQRRITPKSAINGGAELIANGEVDIGLYLLSEVLTVKGVAVAGMLPPALQNYIVYAGAVLADSPAPEPAAEFIRFVADPSREQRWKTTGCESVSQAK